MEYYSVIKKNEILPFAATWMDLEIIILSEVSQTEKDKYDVTYVESNKVIQMNLITKQKQTHRYTKQTYDYKRGKGKEEGYIMLGISRYTLLYIK